MTFDLYDYSHFCGPSAYAVLAGVAQTEAAGALCRWSVRAGWPPSFHTSPTVLAAALMSKGFRFERWEIRPGGWLVERVDDFQRRIFRRLRGDAQSFDELVAGIEEIYACSAAREANCSNSARELMRGFKSVKSIRAAQREIAPYTVSQWLARFPIGTWVLHVARHVMVQRRGRIIAGDARNASQHGEAPLLDVWRVIQPMRSTA